MINRFEYLHYYGGFPVIKPPAAVIITAIDTEPIDYKPETTKEFAARMLKLYQKKGYPLGKTKRGAKKWIKRTILKAVGCKSINQAVRKYKRLRRK